MPHVTFIDADGHSRVAEGAVGDSVMMTAVKNGIPGIVGECGGNASCATCHIYVEDQYLSLLDPPGELEEDLLDLGVTDRREASRLSCQISITEMLEGLTVRTPAQQS